MVFLWMNVTSFERTTFTIFLLSFLSSAINPGCKCIRFSSTFGKEWGVLSSPDYPESYPNGIRCLLYSFHAPKDHIVQVVLEDFNLPETKSPTGCLPGDYLKFFLHLEEDGVNELTPWNSLLCGQHKNQSFYSSSRHLIIQFHSAMQQRMYPRRFGFMGSFRFVDASQFESNGRLVPGTKCDYQFQSANVTVANNGRFFSPNYPSNYPYNVKCSYFFHASLHERVKIIFERVNLQPLDSSCLNKTDVIRVVDGSSPTSSVISLICNDVKGFEVLSTGPDLVVEFIANSEYPNTGFRGKFHFVKIQFDNAQEGLQLRHYQPSDSLNSSGGHDGLTQASTLIPQCNQVVTSDGGRNGTFTSPNYPHQYPPKTECRFDFIGHGRERVQILFTDLSFYHPERNPKSCNGEDSLTAFIHSEGNLTQLEDFCGINTPLSLMSNGHRLTLELNAPKSSRGSRGFSAMYFFVEDFGVKTGRQLKDYPCAFVFNSSLSPNGTFSSPNYPGPYPRDTECHYFFYGHNNEHVDLHFQQFSLNGSPPCDETTKSDYIEFSNYMPVDRNFKRTCGTLESFMIQSDGTFFRVTFRSNSFVDSTGFFAMYSFCDKMEHKQRRASNSGSTETTSLSLLQLIGWILMFRLLKNQSALTEVKNIFQIFLNTSVYEYIS